MEVTSRTPLHDHLMHGNDKRKTSRKRKDYTEPEDPLDDLPLTKSRKKKRSYKYKPPQGSTKGGRWTIEEKKKFLNGVLSHGRGKWSSIAKDIPTRTVVQVKTHAQSLFKRFDGKDLKQFVKEELEFIDKNPENLQRKQEVPLTPTRRETQSIVSNDEVKEEEMTQVPKKARPVTKKKTKTKKSRPSKQGSKNDLQKEKEDVPVETIHIPASLENMEGSMAVFDNIQIMSSQEIQDQTNVHAQEAPPTPTLPQNYEQLAYPSHTNYAQPTLFSPMLCRHMPPTPASYYQRLNLHGEPAKVDKKMFDECEQGYDTHVGHVGQELEHGQDVQVDMEEVNQSFHLWMQQEHGEDAEKDMKQENGFPWPETLLPMQNAKQIQSLQNDQVIPMEVQLEPQLPIPMEVQLEPQLPFSFIGGPSSPLRMAMKLSPRRRLSPRKLSPKKQPNLPLPFFSSPPPMVSVSAAVPVATPSVATPGNMATPPSAASTYLMNSFSKGKGMAQKNLKEIQSRKVSMEKSHPTSLSTPEDVTKGNLNSLHQYVRSELLEIYLATDNERCGNQRLYEKRVGFQCVHCANCSNDDVPANYRFFPKSLEQIYRGVCTWQRVHFLNCKHTPDAAKQHYTHLKTSDKTKGRTAYWVEAAKAIGLKDNDSEQGIIFS